MKWKRRTAETTKVNRTTTTPHYELEHYCRDLNSWPGSWIGWEKDLPPGEELVTLFRPFLEHLAASDLSPGTIQKHVDNMWALGGEFIRELHSDPALRKRSVDKVLSGMIEYGGPLLYHGGEDQQRSFDSTCRKFRRFLTDTAR
ncbi:MAG TPA: hypothetical protein VM715_10345 [Candidatus Acidoferrum sp.]|nr:hypothetical protein [Candidatus Acidoferrum sp.]